MEIIKFNKHSSTPIKELKLKYYCFDFDNNLLDMDTKIHMDKKEGNSWIPVNLSTSDFAVHRNDKENYRMRNNDPDQAFCEFRDFGPRGPKAFLMDVKEALKQGNFAPSWNTFIKCLSEGAIFCILTARGHDPESIRIAIEYIIDTILTKLPSKNPERTLADEMYQNIGKYMYYFREMNGPIGDIKLKGQPSKNPIIQKYLDQCDFYGINSEFFSKEFGGGNMSFGPNNPEKAKEIGLNAFIDKCNGFGRKLTDYSQRSGHPIKVKSVSVGFSDDDPRNVSHVKQFFNEKPVDDFEHEVKLNVYDTSVRGLEGGTRSKHYKTNEIIKFNYFINLMNSL